MGSGVDGPENESASPPEDSEGVVQQLFGAEKLVHMKRWTLILGIGEMGLALLNL